MKHVLLANPSHPEELLTLEHLGAGVPSGMSGDSVLTIITAPTGPAKLQIRVS